MKTIEKIGTFILGVIFGVLYICTIHAHTTPIERPEPEIQYVYIEAEPEVITETVYVEVEPEFFRNHTEQEEWYYKDLGMREAEGEGVIGILWVMYTAECRCEAFGTTIEQEWGGSAFQTSMFRSGLEPNEDCLKAYELFREGWMPKPLNFRAGTYHGFREPLCQVGQHYFSA